jgi:hypothetical protein
MRLRRQAGALVVAAAAFASVLAPAPRAGALDECAQRVIRDWYSGGRVDDVYPLACYRAALRALPADVLQYSNADQDIRRALAYARRGRSDPGAAPAPPATAAKQQPRPAAASTTKTAAAPEVARAQPASKPKPASKPASKPKPAPVAPASPAQAQAAGIAAEAPGASASLPYPILVLTALAVVLLTTGAAGWILGRRR